MPHQLQASGLPELHANIEVVKEVPSKCHAILRGENSVDPACRGQQSTDVYSSYLLSGLE